MTTATRSALDATSAFYGTSRITRALRLALAALQRLWPSFAVRAAARIFGTPLPPRWLRQRDGWDAHWQIDSWAFEDASLTFYRLRDAPPGRIVLLAHGWGGHSGQLRLLAEAVARRGFAPLLLDLPAHGRSAGRVSNLPQFARAIDYVAARLRHRGEALHAVVAHSLAASAAAHAASRGLPAARLVLLAPPASPQDYTRLFAGVFGLSEATRAAMQARVESREGVVMRQFEPDVVGPGVRLPTLIVHDRGDSINGFADGVAFAHAIAGAQLMPTEGLGHRKILKDGPVIARVGEFLSTA
jgi:Serine aminopeptidase, S33